MNRTHRQKYQKGTNDSTRQLVDNHRLTNDFNGEDIDDSKTSKYVNRQNVTPSPGQDARNDVTIPGLSITKRLWTVIGSRSRCGYLYRRYVNSGYVDFGVRCYNSCLGHNSVFVDLCWLLLILFAMTKADSLKSSFYTILLFSVLFVLCCKSSLSGVARRRKGGGHKLFSQKVKSKKKRSRRRKNAR